ncbi:protein FAR1-RELATED SEQUENCE 5-like [Silene latifolia]|uniref:protein FAR1-RELATED SEQUENCE 5-like n=1 Tax=Silene latifolia TaxID=37657 RepID=UPI003D78A611
MIRFRYNSKGYVVDMFHDFHNHILCSVKDAHLQKLTRKLNAFHKQAFINIGTSTSFRLCKEYANGYENVGTSLTEFKNFNRDVKCFTGGKDAQMVIDRFKEISETSTGFYFAYYTDESHILSRLFWCDSQSRQNYSLFGDAVSFDATYGTNKYNIMFAPFTGVDHHKKSVTFGAALLEHEDEESFKWCLENFLDAMNKKEPQCVVTDQAPGLILAVPKVFNKARHRFCMWHIMQKVTVKVSPSICKDIDFLPRFNSVVWDITLTVPEFEFKWVEICALVFITVHLHHSPHCSPSLFTELFPVTIHLQCSSLRCSCSCVAATARWVLISCSSLISTV